MAFQRREVAKLAKEMVDITHELGREAMMFLGDHWIGTEPFMPEFAFIGLDAVVGSVGNGSTLRLISDKTGERVIPAVEVMRTTTTIQACIREGRLVFAIASEAGDDVGAVHLSLGPFRQVVKDYFQICESYFDAVKRLPPGQIEAIDMARRGIHNEGARTLQERLEGKAELDIDTARRLFTLICALVPQG